MLGLGGILKKKESAKNAAMRPLSFEIEKCASGEVVEEVGLPIRRYAIKGRSNNFYCIDDRLCKASQMQKDKIAIAKACVIEKAVSEGIEAGPTLMGYAEGVAMQELMGCMEQGYAEYASRIISHDTAGFGPISMLMEDKQNIEEIEINSPTSAISVVHSKLGRCATNLRFCSEQAFRSSINRLIYSVDKELSEDYPIIDAQVGDARVHAQMRPYAASNGNATIRLRGRRDIDVCTMIKNGNASPSVLAYLWMAVSSGMNIVIAGAPGSGKTTMLTALLSFSKRSSRIVVIEEDISEFKFYPNVINMVHLYGTKAGISTREQALNALRMRPDAIVIGEVRGKEAMELFSAANVGVQFLTTMHSGGAKKELLDKLSTKPMEVDLRSLRMLDLAIYMKDIDGKKAIYDIAEFNWLSRAEIVDPDIVIGGDSVKIAGMMDKGELNAAALPGSKVMSCFAAKNLVQQKQALKEMGIRERFLKSMCGKDLHAIETVQELYNFR